MTTDAVARWLDQLVADELAPDRVEAWVERTAGAILEQTPEVADDPMLADLLRAAVRAHWLAFLAELGGPAREVRLVPPASEFAAGLAQRQIHMATLFKVYRIAQQATWRYLTERVRDRRVEDLDDAEVLVRAWDRASDWIDSSITASVDIHQAESDRIRQGAAAQLLDQVRRALAGEVEDPQEFSALLGGYPVSVHHTGIVLRTENSAAVTALEGVARQLAGDLGAPRPLVVEPGGRELWCWAATRDRPDLQAIEQRADLLRERGVAAYVGTPRVGLDGFALTHREAQSAQRIARRTAAPQPLTLFPDVEVLALITQSDDAAARFVERVLGDLGEDSDNARRLRETVAVLLELGSVDAAAKRLTVHKNTVRYRVARAEEVLGHPVSAAPVELALALRYQAAFRDAP